VEQAELNLEWTKVTSLVDGIAGIAQVQIGNLVGSSSILTSVRKSTRSRLFSPLRNMSISSRKAKQSHFQQTHHQFFRKLTPTDPDRRQYLPSKRENPASRSASGSGTGTIRIVAAFPNPGNVLRPGQYGRVRVETSTKKTLAATAKRRSESAGKLSGGSCRQRSQSEYAHRKTRCNGRDDVGD